MNKSVLSGEKLETLPLKLESRYPHSYWTLDVKSSAEQLASRGKLARKSQLILIWRLHDTILKPPQRLQ